MKPAKPVSRPYKALTIGSRNENVNDENTNNSNIAQNRVICLSKKIKKDMEAAPPRQPYREVQFRTKHQTKSYKCYSEGQLQLGPLAEMTIPHRLDNDCESDSEQVAAGVQKLLQSLQEAIQIGKASPN